MNKIQVHENICKSLNELYARKNADYGDSFGKSFREYGLTMACIRLGDKLNRIKALSKQEAQVSDESITDTLMDLANYSIMTLVELSRDKIDDAIEDIPCFTCIHEAKESSEYPCCECKHTHIEHYAR